MGKFLLILMLGLSVSSGIIVLNKNRQLLETNDMVVEHFSDLSAKNAANSGVFMALNRLYLDSSWRTGYSNQQLNNDTLNVTVADNGTDASIPLNQVKITATGQNGELLASSEAMAFDRNFHDFAVWAKDSVKFVTTKDSMGVVDTTLTIDYAPFMPYIDYTNLVNDAVSQGHVYSGGGHFHPIADYPNPASPSFYYSGLTPNVTHVESDLHVQNGRTVYGIYIVEGKILLDKNTTVEGIIYAPNTATLISNKDNASSYVTGGIVTWGAVDGKGYQIYVDHEPAYMRAFASNYAPDNPRLRLLSWK
ncbi:MAG: hypothetical protein ACE5I1_08200 [bacterium]